jgi:hypothetical protein
MRNLHRNLVPVALKVLDPAAAGDAEELLFAHSTIY